MKKIASKLIAGVVAISMVLATPISALAYTNTGAVDTDDFIRGVDASTLDMLEDLGAVYYQNGVQGDALTILHNNGANYVRLKLWVDPYDANGNAYGGGNNDYATTLALAQRAKNLGMGILIDFHLSDFWADPANQIKPKAWENLTYSQLQTTVYNYMKTTLNNFASAGIVPDMVQVGNEISAGILYEDGQIVVNGTEDFSGLAGLLEYAIAGVRDSSAANTKIILHLDMGGQNSLYTWFFRGLLTESPNLDFDVFGLSYYPMWHGTMEGLQYNLNYLANTYNKEVCVVETAYAWTTEDGDGVGNVFIEGDEETGGYEASTDGQFEFMNDLETVLLNVPNDLGIGFFYWEPEWVPVQDGTYATSAGVAYKNDTVTPSNTWDNMTLFDFNGNALSSIKVLNQPTENLLSNISFEADNAVTSSPSSWNVWLDNSVPTGTVKTEYGNAYDGNYKVTFWDDDDYTCSIYKTFTNIPNGTYQFTIWAMSNGGQDTLQMYAKNYGGTEIDTAITTSDVNWNMFSIDEITVTNNTLEIGVYAVANANDWCNLDLAILRKVD
ncbi:glycoside hydrolase family 53 protein [Bacteroides heparinolyticus]|uniref:glycoside hydrolase family 53 protein n=1 Tax=Prevotella heparinolytica TaxID=28113 RepID=UPI0035A09837